MIRRANLLSAALVAMLFVLGTVMAVGALAAEMILPGFTNAGKEEATATAGKGSVTIEGGARVTCEKVSGNLSFAKGSTQLGTLALDIQGCTQGGEPCQSLGDTGGSVLADGEWALVLEIKETKMLYLMAIVGGSELHVECPKSAVKLFLFFGAPLGLIEPGAATKAKEYKGIITALKGVQTEKAFENNKGEQVLEILEVSQEGGKRKTAGLESENNVLTFLKENEIKN